MHACFVFSRAAPCSNRGESVNSSQQVLSIAVGVDGNFAKVIQGVASAACSYSLATLLRTARSANQAYYGYKIVFELSTS